MGKTDEPVHKGLDDEVVVGAGARAREHRADEPAEGRGVEFGAPIQLQLLNRLSRDVGRGQRLGGALHRRFVKRRAEVGRRLVGLGEVAFLILEQHLGDAGIARRGEGHEGERRHGGEQGRKQNCALAAEKLAHQRRSVNAAFRPARGGFVDTRHTCLLVRKAPLFVAPHGFQQVNLSRSRGLPG